MSETPDYLRSIGAWTREQLEIRRETRSLIEALYRSAGRQSNTILPASAGSVTSVD